MKTLTIELPDDVAADLAAEQPHLGAKSLAEAAVSLLRERLRTPDAAAMEAEMARAWHSPTREMTDEVVEEWIEALENGTPLKRSAHA